MVPDLDKGDVAVDEVALVSSVKPGIVGRPILNGKDGIHLAMGLNLLLGQQAEFVTGFGCLVDRIVRNVKVRRSRPLRELP